MKIIRSAGGSTHGLHVHLQTQHGVNLLKCKAGSDVTVTDSVVQQKRATTITSAGRPTMANYVTAGTQIGDQTMAATIARMTACDGLSFRNI